jgi:hypothetical protein
MAIYPSQLAGISQKSNEIIWVSCRSEDPMSGVQNLSTLPVEVAFKLDDDPDETDWKPAIWRSTTPWVNPEDGLEYYLAQVEVGPGGVIAFTAGNWLCWARVTTGTDKPVFGPSVLKVI